MDPSPAAPTIHLFSVDARDLPNKRKELTFTWNTSGGSEVMLVCGNQRRFGKWWMVGPTGELTVELDRTLYPDPPMFLTVKNAAGQSVKQTVRVSWPCSDRYFFEPERGRAAVCQWQSAESPPPAFFLSVGGGASGN